MISNALAATRAVGGPQQPRVEQLRAPLPPVAFDITITFNKQTACVRVALTGEDYSDKPLKALLAQINVHAANEVSGAYTIVGLSQGGARLDSGKAHSSNY